METQSAAGPTPARGGNQKGKKLIWILILVVVLAGLGAGAYYLLQTPGGLTDPSPTPQLTSQFDTPPPQQTDAPESIEKSEVTIEVLNGTGISGEAGFLQDELEELGYSNIEVGNADETDNEDTEVFFSEEFANSSERQELVTALEEIYQTVNVSSQTIDDFDVRVITGLRIGQTARPDATTAPVVEEEEDEEETAEESPSSTPTSTP